MIYKPSKFNFIHKCDNGELLLYNSAIGANSLIRVTAGKKGRILEILKEGYVGEIGNKDIQLLCNKGYMVPIDSDENILKKFRIMEQVMDNSLHLILLPTEQCNFRCKYCYETFKKGKMSENVQEAIITYVRKNIHKYTGLSVSWFGGEPLEALDVVEKLSGAFQNICKTAKRPYSAGMTTNGYNLSLEIYKRLYDLGIYNYQITIDGLKDEHDRQRVLLDGRGTFDTIVENLIDIRKNTRYINASFIIRTNFTKRIYENIEQFLDFYVKTFNDDRRFNFYIHMASDWGGDRVHAFSGEMLSNNQYREILKAILRHGIQINYTSHFSHLNYYGCICYACRKNSIVIGSDGTLYKCTGDFEFEKNKVGILVKNGSLQYNDYYMQWLGGIWKDEEKCENCFYSACCLSNNCPAIRIKELKNETCSFEKENMGLFLELFNKSLFCEL